MTVRALTVELATPESIAPFGELVGPAAHEAPLPSAFYEGFVSLYRPANFVSDHDTEITVARIDRRPLQVRWMERHFKHTQVFIPLAGRPMVVVMAPPNDAALPDLEATRAILFDGSCGFAMHIGTWHEFPFSLVDGTDVIVVLRREATDGLMKDVVVDGEGQSPDLDKRDIVRRMNVTLEARL